MTTTDYLYGILLLVRTGFIALVLIGIGIFVGRRRTHSAACSPYALQYRQTSFIFVLGFLFFAADVYTSGLLPLGPLLLPVFPALRLLIYLVAIPIAYREARLADWAAVILDAHETDETLSSKSARILWPLAGFFGVLGSLSWLELKHPFYFTQDDNLVVNLAEVVYGCGNFFHGIFPTWNPYQYMGSPTATLGWYAFTYPPTYVSYWIADSLIGNANATLEVFAFFHLLISYFVFYWLVRREGCRPAVAMMASLSCMLSGYALIFSRSWFQFSAVLLWTALMLACVQSFMRGPRGWRWIVLYGMVIGIAFHAGHIQMWIYSVMLADLAILIYLWTGVGQVRDLWKVVSAHFLGLAIAAPLLLPMLQTLGHVLRRHPDSRGIIDGLAALFVPATVYSVHHPSGWDGSQPHPRLLGEMYYSGTLFIVLCALLLISLLSSRWTRQTVKANVWFICGLVALWCALGNRGFLWNLMMHLPGFSGFRFPFKFLAYIVIFSGLAGALVLERLMRRFGTGFRTEVFLAAGLLAVLAYHVSLSTESFYSYGFRPYPAPNPALAAKLIPHDNISYPKVFPFRGLITDRFEQNAFASRDPHLFDNYGNQFPTVLKAFSIEGYNPLVSESPTIRRVAKRLNLDPQRTLYEYGVQYTLQYNSPEERPPYRRWEFDGARPIYRTRQLILQELPKPRPMAFTSDAPEQPLPVDFDAAGASIHNVPSTASGVTLNMLWHREIRAYADGRRVPAWPDDWDRIVLQVPPGTKEVRVSFRPAWEFGFAAGIIFLIVGAFLGWWSMKTPVRAEVADQEMVAVER